MRDYETVIRGELDIDSCMYAYDFVDDHVAQVFRRFHDWERPSMDLVYEVQALARGEVPSEETRRAVRGGLASVRELDLTFLRKCVDTLENKIERSELQIAATRISRNKENVLLECRDAYRIALQKQREHSPKQ